MNYKYKFILAIILIFYQAEPLTIYSQSFDQPYMLTQDLSQEPVDIESCRIYLNESGYESESVVDNTLDLSDRKHQINEELTQIQSDYEALNQSIALLESGPDNSIAYANGQLAYVIEVLYEEAATIDSNFMSLSEEEQFNIISQNETVIEWQQYIAEIQAAINQSIVDRDALESQYLELNYELESIDVQMTTYDETMNQANQCLLYAYSTEKLHPENILLNQQVDTLSEYLVQIDQYLNLIIPSAYHQVTFDQIYQIFNTHLTSESLEQVLVDKQIIVMDELALQEYSYAKELSLAEIETVAQFAQRIYLENQNLETYTKEYQKIINLKEAQFQYIYSINQKAFDLLQNQLVSYLNEHLLFDNESIEQMKLLQEKYQLKLVFFDDINQLWEPNKLGNTGFLSTYISQSIDGNDNHNSLEESDDIGLDFSDDESGWANFPTPIEPTLEDMRHSNLENIKNRLIETDNKPSDVKDLPKPSTTPSLADAEKPSENTGGTNKGMLKLPDTGELQTYTLIGLVFLLVGAILLLYNLYIKRKKREDREKIELD